MKLIDAEKLIKAIEEKGLDCSFTLKMERLDTLALIDKLQQEQKPAEWSKEDERMLHGAITIIERNSICNRNMINWLKSLRPQPKWKPSEEQMKALNDAVANATPQIYATLSKLYNDLKKLI